MCFLSATFDPDDTHSSHYNLRFFFFFLNQNYLASTAYSTVAILLHYFVIYFMSNRREGGRRHFVRWLYMSASGTGACRETLIDGGFMLVGIVRRDGII